MLTNYFESISCFNTERTCLKKNFLKNVWLEILLKLLAKVKVVIAYNF